MKKMFFVFAATLFIASITHAQGAKDSTTYKDYYGKYKFEAGSPIDDATVLWNGTEATLVLSTSMGDATLTLLGKDSFSMSYENGTLLFKRGDGNKVNQLVIMVSGTVLEGKKDEPGAALYADYLGNYKFEAGSALDEINIVWKDGAATITSSMGDATLTKLGTDSFSMSYENGTVLFKRGSDGKVNHITIEVSGTTLEGTKSAAPAGTALRKEYIMSERKAVAVK